MENYIEKSKRENLGPNTIKADKNRGTDNQDTNTKIADIEKKVDSQGINTNTAYTNRKVENPDTSINIANIYKKIDQSINIVKPDEDKKINN